MKSDSDWREYVSSSDIVKKRIEEEGIENFERHILSLHTKHSESNFYEVWWQMKYDVLNDANAMNENIASKWFKKNVSTYSRLFNESLDHQ